MNNELSIARLSGFGRGEDLHFTQDVVTLGTDAGCDVRFDSAWDKTASARHATLRRDGRGGWRLEDTSRDGCWINGKRLPARHAIEPGETVVEIGRGGPRIRLTYQAEEPAALVPVVVAPPPGPAPAHGPVYAHPSLSPPPALANTPVPAPGRKAPNLALLYGIPVGLVILGIVGWLIFGSRPVPVPPGPVPGPAVAVPPGNADERLAAVATKYEDAVGLVVFVQQLPKTRGDAVPFPEGTAWAIGEHVFATNAHVARPAAELMARGNNVFIVVNRHPDQRFRVTRAVVHPKYAAGLVNFDGRKSAVPAYDVGLLYIDGTTPNRLPVAPETELHKLASGYRVGYLGFPMENLAGEGVDFRNPVATMQSGILTSVTDYWLSRADYSNCLLLQHNLGAVGGASGSPIFNAQGEVVGLLSAGNIVGQVNLATGKVERAPSAAMINFAQRVDILRDIYPEYGK